MCESVPSARDGRRDDQLWGGPRAALGLAWVTLLALTQPACVERRVVEEETTTIRATGDTGSAGGSTVVVVDGSAGGAFPDPGVVEDIALADEGGCALLSGGRVLCFTYRGGQPTEIEGLGSDITRIWGGGTAYCALDGSERVSCWGRLGIEDGISRVAVPMGLPPVEDIALGEARGCARLHDGTLRCWGRRWEHPGPFDIEPRAGREVEAIAGLRDVSELTARDGTTCVIRRDGTLRCLGRNLYTRIAAERIDGFWGDRRIRQVRAVALTARDVWIVQADGSVATRRSFERPRTHEPDFELVVMEDLDEVERLASARSEVCAMRRGGAVWCWDADAPSPRPTLITDASRLVGGGDAFCARTAAGWFCRRGGDAFAPFAWFDAGAAAALSTSAPTQAAVSAEPACGYGPEHSAVIDVAAGYAHACALISDGSVRCWGSNYAGQTSGRVSPDVISGSRTVPLRGRAIAIDVGWTFGCARMEDQSMWCWGDHRMGQMGVGGRRSDLQAPARVALRHPVAEMALGREHACARTEDGDVWCWGRNRLGEVGDGTTEIRTSPVQVRGIRGATAIAAGDAATCAATDAGVFCWGMPTGEPTPTPVGGLEETLVAELAVGSDAACARTGDGEVRCWGAGRAGQLGSGAPGESESARRVEGVRGAVRLSAWLTSFCAIDDAGAVTCWGRSPRREASPAVPRPLEWISRAADVDLGTRYSCVAEAETGGVCCWDDRRGAPAPVTW